MRVPVCPTCGNRATLLDDRFNRKYGCCGLWSWGGKPLVDAETHRARQAAHEAFDRIWKKGVMSRSAAYAELANRLGVPEPEAHMSVMSAETARRVPPIAQEMMSRMFDDQA